MMTTTEILNEIHRLPLEKQLELREKLLEENESSERPQMRVSQDEFDRMLFEDGFLVSLPVEDVEEDDYEPVEFIGKPISETIIEERR